MSLLGCGSTDSTLVATIRRGVVFRFRVVAETAIEHRRPTDSFACSLSCLSDLPSTVFHDVKPFPQLVVTWRARGLRLA